MQFIPLKNNTVNKYLSKISEVLFTEEYAGLISKAKPKKDSLLPNLYPCSDEYLFEAQKLRIEDYGFPRASQGLGMTDIDVVNSKIAGAVSKPINKMGLFLGATYNALVMAYPDKGYIGWHHNGNAAGYNILFSYSQDGDGCFKYYDRASKKIITMQDTPGWMVKVGYYPNQTNEKDRVYWHCAETTKQRISVAWVVNHREIWKSMINSISDGTFNNDVLFQDQMNVKK